MNSEQCRLSPLCPYGTIRQKQHMLHYCAPTFGIHIDEVATDIQNLIHSHFVWSVKGWICPLEVICKLPQELGTWWEAACLGSCPKVYCQHYQYPHERSIWIDQAQASDINMNGKLVERHIQISEWMANVSFLQYLFRAKGKLDKEMLLFWGF